MKDITRAALDRYAKDGIETGSFLRAVLENDLFQAVHRADSDNLRDIQQITEYVNWELPAGCWGSKEKVQAWLKGAR